MLGNVGCRLLRRRRWFFVVLFWAVAMLGACHPSGPVAGDESASSKNAGNDFERYAVRGEVLELDAEKQVATLKHDEIVGWMDAMTMSFPVPDKTEWGKLSVGALIRATLFVNDDGFHLGEIEMVQPDGQ
jgi:Cu/Ag efflux protein CusF